MISNAVSVDNKDCSPLARASMLYSLQLLVNKFGAATEPLLQIVTQLVESVSSKSSVEEVDHIYQTLSYFAAASLAGLEKSTKSLIKLMLDSITNPTHGRKVAQSFRILLAPSEILTKENFCVIRPLRKGRLWTLTVSDIITMFRSKADNQTIKENCLIALASVLGYMELALLQEHVDQIFPLLLEATNVKDDDETKAACIKIILDLIPVPSCQPVVESHLDSIIARMTDRTHNTYDSPSDVRIPVRALALDVLGALAKHINPALLKSRKNKLMTELDFALDDCSREVRNRAGMCKMAWFNLADL
jgi:DNA repair/transcription protein MET18/MMS19